MKHSECLFGYSFSDIHITEKIKDDIRINPKPYANCDVRVRMGLIYTEEEKECYIETSLKRKLPTDKNKVLFLGKRR